MNHLSIQFFLKYGYFPGYSSALKIDIANIDKNRFLEFKLDTLIDTGIEKFKKAIERNFQNNKENLIPLSGGLDSRAILAFLNEFTESKNIFTYTFGTPGTHDYDIGNIVAKHAGTNHRSFPLTQHKYTLEEEIEVAKQIDYQTILFHHPPMLELLKDYQDMVVWSGYEVWKQINYKTRIFRHPSNLLKLLKISGGKIVWSPYIGDWINKKHISENSTLDINSIKDIYAKKHIMGNGFNLPNNKDLNALFLFEPTISPKRISYEEQIELQNYLISFTAPHLLYKSLDIKTPHLDQTWLDFMMSLPSNLRSDENLFKRILLKHSPDLFQLPTKGTYALPLNCSKFSLKKRKYQNIAKKRINRIYSGKTSKRVNYIDFNKAIRKREEFSELILNNINDLKERNIVNWIDIDKIWNEHIKGYSNYTNELLLMASLEIHFKSGKKL